MCAWGHCPAQRWYFCFQSLIFHSLLQIILQNLAVEIYIHLSINLASIPNPIPGETAPHHQRPSSKFECRLNKPSIQDLPGLFLHPFPSICPNPLILVLSDQIILFQSSTVQSGCAIAQSSLYLWWCYDENGLLVFSADFIPAYFKFLLKVCTLKPWFVISWKALWIWTVIYALPELMCLMACLTSDSDNLVGQLPRDLDISCLWWFITTNIVPMLIPTLGAICQTV